MALDLSYDELLRYTNDEREKWRRWLQSHPEAMDAALQPGGRFPTVGKLIDHVFLVERRHLAAADRRSGLRVERADGQQRPAALRLWGLGAAGAGAVCRVDRRRRGERAADVRGSGSDPWRCHPGNCCSTSSSTRSATGRRSRWPSGSPVSSRPAITICSTAARCGDGGSRLSALGFRL